MIFIGLKSGNFGERVDVFMIAVIQLLMIISYADYISSIVRRELLKEQEKILFTLKAMEQAKKL